jgi:tRNA-splicing ligase RtcB
MGRLTYRRIDDNRCEIPRSGNMRVPGLVYARQAMIEHLLREKALEQVRNVACLPGIVRASLAMPDIHWGYGFPIGGVAAFRASDGVVSPGGVGYDINCGVRLLGSRLQRQEVIPILRPLVEALFRRIPSGVGSRSQERRLTRREMRKVMVGGAGWAIERGDGVAGEDRLVEEGGRLEGADPDLVSEAARERGSRQLGTLGSGNHFAEVGFVDQVFEPATAAALGLEEGRVTLSIHTGSRGLGYQVCDDSIRTMLEASRRYGIELPDRQLCCAPLDSSEGRGYLGAMYAAANFAFANRQTIAHRARQAFSEALGRPAADVALTTIYDVCHNIAKWEEHVVEGRKVRLCVHRKGATRAFPPGHSGVPREYRSVGQPVLIPGDMGRYSYVLVGTRGAMEETFGSSCHGAGRRLSRTQAGKQARGRDLMQEMEARGVVVRATGRRTVAEEMPEAYKDVTEVVDVVDAAGLARKVVRLRPMGVIKG